MVQKGVNIQNRQARHEYTVLETFEAGIELFGTEVKSIRAGSCSLKEAFCVVEHGEVYVRQMHISPYEQGNIYNKDPIRIRKLLLHKAEIRRLDTQVKQKGLTLIPLSVYSKGSLMKISLGLCRGKKLYDKRDDAAKRDSAREIQRAAKDANRSE